MWRTSRLTVHGQEYFSQCKTVNDLIHQSKMEYFSVLVVDHQSDPKKLFATVDGFLHLLGEKKLPHCDNSQLLAEKFADCFTEKISKVRAGLHSRMSQLNDWNFYTRNISKVSCSNLSKFQPVSSDVLSNIILSTTSKSCDLEPLPASVLKGTVDTEIVNLSLDQALVPHVF